MENQNFRLENICGYYRISRNLLQRDILEMKEAINHYKQIGCYECSGHNKTCKIYFNPVEEYERGLKSGK